MVIYFCSLPLSKGRHISAPFKKTGIVSVSLFLCFLLPFEIVLSRLGRDLTPKLNPLGTIDTDFCSLELCKNRFLLFKPPNEWYYFYCRWRQ